MQQTHVLSLSPLKEGEVIEYDFYSNCNVKHEISFKDGLMHGKYTYFQEDGTPILSAEYKHGKKDGVCQVFYNNGVLSHEFWCKDDQKHGDFTFFDPYGSIIEHCVYKNNEKIDF